MNQKEELQKYESRYKSLITEGQEFKITNDLEKNYGINLIRDLTLLGKQYKKLREYLVKPIKDHVKKIENDIKPYEKEIEKIIGNSYNGLRGQLASYETKCEEERWIEEEKLRVEQQKEYDEKVKKADEKCEVAPAPPAPAIIERKKEEGVSYREELDYQVINKKLIPSEYLMVDEKKLKKVVKAGVDNIPGIKIFKRKIPVIKAESLDDL